MKNLIEKFEAELALLADDQLVARFNREVGNRGWVNARAFFLEALRNQFVKRDINFTLIQNEMGGLKLANKVQLWENKLIF